MATILVYLTTPSKGGHTVFPAASFNATTVHSFLEITPPRGEYWRVDENAEVCTSPPFQTREYSCLKLPPNQLTSRPSAAHSHTHIERRSFLG